MFSRAFVKRKKKSRVIVRVPHIPGYNAPDDVEESLKALREMGVSRLDVFTYRA